MMDGCVIYGCFGDRVCVQLTVERHPEEEPVGNVHHDGPQQVESVHVSRGVRHVHQTVQVFGRGRHTNPHRPLEAGTRQSCKDAGRAQVPVTGCLVLFLPPFRVVSLLVRFVPGEFIHFTGGYRRRENMRSG